ncbi:MAG: prepilin-type N-terminal cleavage/methylation domain-containing protein [Thermoguttaceae bacterium]|nr:prepilin-type N-terminal cleavage/methylation domain-containing protein [Thermoguttaceae bacterium]MDW8038690.1 prepilin-type N-terminal cleavage/methylation domain-containing protein [Thermoguttaceae bacterium]
MALLPRGVLIVLGRYPCLKGQPARRGLTLIEMLVATTITLIMMAAVVQIFAMIGQNVTNARAMLEMNEQLQRAGRLLHQDLQTALSPFNVPSWGQESPGDVRITDNALTDTLELTTRYAIFADGRAESPAKIEWKVQNGQLLRTVSSLTAATTSYQQAILDYVKEFDVKIWKTPETGSIPTTYESGSWFSQTWWPQKCSQWLSANLSKIWDFDGFDNDSDGLVDEMDEFQPGVARPPEVRGIQITIRLQEPDTQQERELIVVHDFLPK